MRLTRKRSDIKKDFDLHQSLFESGERGIRIIVLRYFISFVQQTYNQVIKLHIILRHFTMFYVNMAEILADYVTFIYLVHNFKFAVNKIHTSFIIF